MVLYFLAIRTHTSSSSISGGFSLSPSKSKHVNTPVPGTSPMKRIGYDSKPMFTSATLNTSAIPQLSTPFPTVQSGSTASDADDCSLEDGYEIESVLHREQIFAKSLVQLYSSLFHVSASVTEAAVKLIAFSAYSDLIAMIASHSRAISRGLTDMMKMIEVVAEEISSLNEPSVELMIEEKRSVELNFSDTHKDSEKFRSLLQIVSSRSKSHSKHCSAKHRDGRSSQSSLSASRSVSAKSDAKTVPKAPPSSSTTTIVKKKSLSMNFHGSLSGLGDLIGKTIEAGSAAASAASEREKSREPQQVVQQVHYVAQPACYTCQYHR